MLYFILICLVFYIPVYPEHYLKQHDRVASAFVLCLNANQSFAQTAPSKKSQFDLFQNDYDIVMERAETTYFNRSYLKYVTGGLVHYNRTQRVVNGTCEIIKDIKDLRLDVQAYKFLSNEYRFFPITVSVNVCVEYQLNSFRAKDLLKKYSNFDPCNAKKGFYYLYNAMADFSKFPPLMPHGRYKLVGKFFEYADFIWEVSLYGTVQDKPLKWH